MSLPLTWGETILTQTSIVFLPLIEQQNNKTQNQQTTPLTIIYRSDTHNTKMNINLKQAASKKSSTPMGFGLNTRGKKKPKPVFEESSSDDDNDKDDNDNNQGGGQDTSRQTFNKELKAEQAALRSRAEKAISSASAGTNDIYNYDAEYESFSAAAAQEIKQKQASSQTTTATNEKKESRYVSSLLLKAKERLYEKEIIHERKIAREQAVEEANQEYVGKDKFVTKSYKRKLEEREEWVREEEKKNKKEDAEDVRKKVGGSAMIGFYGNLSRIGGAGAGAEVEVLKDDDANGDGGEHGQDEKKHQSRKSTGDSYSNRRLEQDEEDVVEEVEIEQELGEQSKRIQMLQKIFHARDRYLKRKADKEAELNAQ